MKKYTQYIAIFIICLICSRTGVNAKSYVKDLFQADTNLKITEEIDGTAFLAGQKVTIKDKVNGIGFIAGEKVSIEHDQEYVVIAGDTVTISSDIEKDLFLFGSSIDIEGDIGRDAYMFGDTVDLKGTINRNIYIYGATVKLNGNYKGNVVVNAGTINIGEDVKIDGTLKYNDTANVDGLRKDIKTKTYKIETYKNTLKDYIFEFIYRYIRIALFAVILIFLFESLLVKSLNQTKDRTIKNITILCGKGFLILIGIPIIAFMLLLSSLFTSVGVVTGLVYGILVYMSKIFTSYFIAKVIDEKYLKKNLNTYLLTIIGLFMIYVLSIVPVIGGLISFISVILGLGIVGNMIIELKK